MFGARAAAAVAGTKLVVYFFRIIHLLKEELCSTKSTYNSLIHSPDGYRAFNITQEKVVITWTIFVLNSFTYAFTKLIRSSNYRHFRPLPSHKAAEPSQRTAVVPTRIKLKEHQSSKSVCLRTQLPT